MTIENINPGGPAVLFDTDTGQIVRDDRTKAETGATTPTGSGSGAGSGGGGGGSPPSPAESHAPYKDARGSGYAWNGSGYSWDGTGPGPDPNAIGTGPGGTGAPPPQTWQPAGSSGGTPFIDYLDTVPEAGYYAYQPQGKSNNQNKFFQNQFAQVHNQFLGQLGQQITQGQAPTLRFNDFLKGYDFNKAYDTATPSQKGQGFGYTNQFDPAAKWTF